jgi:hypothetical protein
MDWQDALAKAAIEKEKRQQEFIDPRVTAVEREAFRDLSGVGLLHRKGESPAPPELSRIEKEIWAAYHDSPNAREFVAALAGRRIALAAVTKDEADRSHRQAEFAKAVGNYAPRYRDGEILAITEPGSIFRRDGQPVEARRIFRLDERTTGHGSQRVERFLEPVRNGLKGLDATTEILNSRREDRGRYWDEIRLANSRRTRDGAPTTRKRDAARIPARGGTQVANAAFGLVANLFEGMVAPSETPGQKRRRAIEEQHRRVAAEKSAEVSRSAGEAAEQKRRQELEEMSRQRDRGGRDR